MGLFNSVIVKCPHCSEENEEQFKPGDMETWYFPNEYKDIPIEYLRYLDGFVWICRGCGGRFETGVNLLVTITNPRVVK